MHIVSSSSAVWCGWTMLGILLCGVLGELFQPGVISQTKDSFRVQGDRVYKESPNNFMGQLMISLFRLGTISMAVYLCTEASVFSFTGFWVIFGMAFAVVLVKMVCNLCVDYAFSLSRRFGDAYEHYGNIVTMATLVLYPVLLVLMRFGTPLTNRWIIGSIGILFMGIWMYRFFRQFVISLRAVLYLLVYACTLEVLPWVTLYILSDQTISII